MTRYPTASRVAQALVPWLSEARTADVLADLTGFPVSDVWRGLGWLGSRGRLRGEAVVVYVLEGAAVGQIEMPMMRRLA